MKNDPLGHPYPEEWPATHRTENWLFMFASMVLSAFTLLMIHVMIFFMARGTSKTREI
jgi:hypothetical protein